MKILFFSNIRTMSGAERVLLDFLGTGPAIESVISAPRGEWLSECRRAGFRVRRLRFPTELRRSERPMWRLSFAARYAGAQLEVTELLSRERPDVLHANNLAAGMYAARAARRRRVPMVWHIHDVLVPGTLEARVLMRLHASAFCLLAVSQAVRDGLQAIGIDPARVVTIPNGVDGTSRFDPGRVAPGRVRTELGIPPGAVVLTMIGQITEHKGSGLTMDALDAIADALEREVRVLIAGTAPPQALEYERGLRRRVETTPWLRDHVHWLGRRDDVPELIADSDIVLNATVGPEPFGMTVLEAMSMGTIVVAADGGGVSEIVDPGSTGVLFRSGDASDLGRVLLETIAQLGRLDEMRRCARRKALHDFSIETKSVATTELYRRAASGNRS